MRETSLPWGAVGLLLLLCSVWGANMAAIKIGSRVMAPVFQAGFRSRVAALCLLLVVLALAVPGPAGADLPFAAVPPEGRAGVQ